MLKMFEGDGRTLDARILDPKSGVRGPEETYGPDQTETESKWTEIKLSGVGRPGGFVGMGGGWGL